MLLSVLVTLCVLVCCASAAQNDIPGKVVAWSNANTQSGPRYVTKSMGLETLSKLLTENDNSDAELVILFTQPLGSLKPSCSQHSLLQQALNGADPVVFKYVYSADSDSSLAEVVKRATQADAVHVVAPAQLSTVLSADSALLQNGKVDVVQVPLSAELDTQTEIAAAQTLRSLLALTDKKVVFAAVDESKAVKPTQSGEYAELLDDSTATTDPIYVYGNPLYKPEGAEYAIYFSGQYLYITPDIFTGLLTSLFIFFAMFTGISCLGSIQGMTSFYDKLPVVGKEA